ncbi:MAG: hypothetical protein Q8M15_10670 [Bacteroidota bacterium]|nr:hypothetical protein [Bacteroidota bacterium]
MKNAILYILILAVSFAYSGETIEYFSKAFGNDSAAWMVDIDCENKSSEQEDSNEEKPGYYHDLHLNINLYPGNSLHPGSLGYRQNHIFPSSDYRSEVFSPPETL